jgi:hypothetical protein
MRLPFFRMRSDIFAVPAIRINMDSVTQNNAPTARCLSSVEQRDPSEAMMSREIGASREIVSIIHLLIFSKVMQTAVFRNFCAQRFSSIWNEGGLLVFPSSGAALSDRGSTPCE